MATQVHCDRFGQEQFVPARQVRSMFSVYVANRDARMANNGLGCNVKDVFSGEEKKMKIAELTKMGVMFPNGKKVKAFNLSGGQSYVMVGRPTQGNFGVFIVPAGQKYEFLFGGQKLAPGSCIMWDGQKTKIISYQLFRKMFIMAPNPVSAGKMRGAKAQRPQQTYQAWGNMAQQPAAPRPAAQQPATPYQQAPQPAQRIVVQPVQAQRQVQQLFAVGRLLRNGELVGLVLSDGQQQAQMPLQQCMTYAENSMIKNVKAVNRNGTKFLSGNGVALESLPYYQV